MKSFSCMILSATFLMTVCAPGGWTREKTGASAPRAGSGSSLMRPTGKDRAPVVPSTTGTEGAPAIMATPASHAGVVVGLARVEAYVYVQLDVGGQTIWAAAPSTQVQVGQTAAFAEGMPMDGYRSNALGITFDRVYFAPSLQVEGVVQAPGAPATAGTPAAPRPVPSFDFTNLARPKGGKTVAELLDEKSDALTGKEVVLRARIVKIVRGVMDRDWVHLRDGTGAEGSNDLTVTAKDAEVEVGDKVLVRGVLIKDKDFGYGYMYRRIIEDARFTRE